MRGKAAPVLAGVGAPLILAGTADAGFVGIEVIQKPAVIEGQAALVCNVFATFDRPGQDLFNAVFGRGSGPLEIHVIGGTFYQHQFGGDTAPNAALIPFFPSLAFDTFVTVGVKQVGSAPGVPPGSQFPDGLDLSPGWPGFGPSSLSGTSIYWAVLPDDPQSDPFNPDYVGGNGQLLIGQFTTLNGFAIEGMFRISVTSNNVFTLLNVNFFHVASPGALALFGAAGLLPTRRRRS